MLMGAEEFKKGQAGLLLKEFYLNQQNLLSAKEINQRINRY